MKFSVCLSLAALLLSSETVLAAAVPSPWTTLTPTATIPGATSDFGSFAFTILVLETGSAKRKRDVTQISDGQVQANTAVAAVTQIGDGQIQAATGTVAAVTQIGDGQIQAATGTVAAVTQIGDGQIQAATGTVAAVTQIGDGQIQAATGTVAAVTQIGDGQIQAATGTVAAVTQIGDGQIQAATGTAAAVTQIGDGQIQAATGTAAAVSQIGDGQIQAGTATVAGQITDGQVQASTNTVAAQATDGQVSGGDILTACVSPDALVVTLVGGILYDSHGRVGSIVANRQFQFDGPPPQAGAIYAGGWSIVPSSFESPEDVPGPSENKPAKVKRDGSTGYKLALGTQTTFYQCLSGDFYNLYDESIGAQCREIEIDVLSVVAC
ncbi:hypothetical protein DFJ63DRAFT_310215 [Scheffersomyces coipomensis]|uniref:uncharacterized protein n=1 Tax=Scheffersomyces coipomensis TaxID=1788519 RepID=UPI00315DB1CA